MKYTIFIHTNEKQMLGAYVGKYTLEKYSKNKEKFTIEILNTDKVKEIKRLLGKPLLYEGEVKEYEKNDLQSFTLGRFMPPELMDYKGRAIVIDPDVFATYSDILELFEMDMGDNAIMCKDNGKNRGYATSVMLLDCAKLKHWSIKKLTQDLLDHKIDYRDRMSLKDEKAKIGLFGEEWNSYDKLTADTKLLHTTLRITQPWRVGLPLDFTPKKMKPLFGIIPREWIHYALGRNPYRHRKHVDPKVEEFFFVHLKEAIEKKYTSLAYVKKLIENGEVRKDGLKVLEKYGFKS